MPFDQVMHKFKKGKLHSGSKKGPKVKDRKQAIAIMMSEKREGKKKNTKHPEYVSVGPSDKVRRRHNV